MLQRANRSCLRACAGWSATARLACCSSPPAQPPTPPRQRRRRQSSTAAGGGTTVHQHSGFRVHQFPILDDNYSYLIACDVTGEAAAVDPAEPETTLAEVEKAGLTLTTVLCTHKHWDHSQGNEALAAHIPGLRVVGTAHEECPAATELVSGGESIELFSSVWQAGGAPVSAKVLFTPYHTAGHVSFLLPGALFCADSLFVGGCGRNFEGTAEQMHDCLIDQFAAAKPETAVYCGHEYTVSNLKFCAAIEPDNAATAAKLEWSLAQREAGAPTVPSTIAEELTYNVFMRTDEASVQKTVGCEGDAVGTMRELRARKDTF